MAGYAGMGVPLTYLIAASFMAAPAGLLFAKLMFPQTEQFSDKQPEDNDSEKPTNVLEAMAGGASAGMQLALNVGAMLIAFVGLIALINGIFKWRWWLVWLWRRNFTNLSLVLVFETISIFNRCN